MRRKSTLDRTLERQAKLEEFFEKAAKQLGEKSEPDIVSITGFDATLKNQDLILDIKFKLAGPKHICSHVKTDLFFNEERIGSFYTQIPHALGKEFQIQPILNLRQVRPGRHYVKVEMAGIWLWPLTYGRVESKEIPINYLPPLKIVPTAEKVPAIKAIERKPGIAVITSDIKRLYTEMARRWKRELEARREK